MLDSGMGKHSPSVLSYRFKEPNTDPPAEYIMPLCGSLLLPSLHFTYIVSNSACGYPVIITFI